MFGSAQNGQVLDDEEDPHSSWTMLMVTTPPCRYRPKGGQQRDDPLQSMDETGQGPRKAIAEDVAGPLGVQPSIYNAVVSSSKKASH